MLLVENRRSLADEINTAHKAGARLRLAWGVNTQAAPTPIFKIAMLTLHVRGNSGVLSTLR